MNKNTVNPCILCGKERVVKKSFVTKEGGFTLTHTTTSCPDKKCQDKVDILLAKEKAKRQYIRSESEKREKTRQHRIQLSRSKNKN